MVYSKNPLLRAIHRTMASALVAAIVWCQPCWVWALDYPRGDTNGDGSITHDDVGPLRDLVMERTNNFKAFTQGDCNQDGEIDVSDALWIENYNDDFDNDGILDEIEAAIDPIRPFDPERTPSTGGTEIPDSKKLDTQGSGYADAVASLRTDAEAVLPGGTATDSDGDGITNAQEQAGWSITAHPPHHNGGPFVTDSLMVDTDRDGLTDQAEMLAETNPLNPDTDGDGYLDGTDPDPLNSKKSVGKSMPDLTPSEIEANNAFQREQDLARQQKGGSGTSGRGLGFQGPESVGSSFESVQSDQFTGAFSYSIPIKVPPGRNGMQPNLALFYRSTNSHSWLGQGWDLNPGRIERSTKNGVPKYSDASNPPANDGDPMTPLDNPDVFLYTTAAGGSQLVFTGTEVIGGQTCGIYHAEVDSGSFVRFIHHPDPAPENAGGGWWEAWMKDGRKAYFGGKGAFNKDSCLYDPDHFNDGTERFSTGWGVFHWGLEREEDLVGNAIVYSYQHPPGTRNMFLSDIRYNYEGALAMARLVFTLTGRTGNETWASYRESYRSKFKMVSDQFLTGITEYVTGRVPVERVRKYVLQYDYLNSPTGRTISCLKSVQEYGETDTLSFPSVTLTYSESPGGWDHYDSGRPNPYLPLMYINYVNGMDYGVRLYDFDGDGMADWTTKVLWATGGDRVEVLSNNGTGWGSAQNRWYPPEYFCRANESTHVSNSYGDLVADVDGDGLQDILWSVGGPWWSSVADCTLVAFNRGNDPARTGVCAAWDFYDTHPYILPCWLGYQWTRQTYGVRTAELNGDGLVDIVQSDCRNNSSYYTDPYYIVSSTSWLNNGSGWTPNGSSYNLPYGIDFQRSSDPTKTNGGIMIDLNADGLTDFAINSVYQAGYVVNTGTGWEKYTSGPYMPHWAFAFPWWSDDYGARVLDVNGDGLQDIVRATSSGSYGPDQGVTMNTGEGWVDGDVRFVPSSFTQHSGQSVTSGPAFGDVNGDGFTDIVYGTNNNGNWWHRYVDINLAKPANLLTHIDNGIGGTVDMEYTPSTCPWMKLHDPATGQVEVTDKVPYVLNVASKVTKTGLWPDHTGTPQQDSYTTLYRYAGGKHLDREFRGFGKVKEIDAATGNFTITEFHQDYARKGQAKSVRSYVGDRRDYRTGGLIDGAIKAPKDESVPAHEPKLVSETHQQYRVVIHQDDTQHLKTFTDTAEKLGLTDFPLGMTLVTPACALTKSYEYTGDYTKQASTVPSVVTAQEVFYDGRGNLLQTTDYGQVAPLVPGATLQDLDNPRRDVTFSDTTSADPDGQVNSMTRYERRGDWMDVPNMVNTAGYYTSNRSTGERAVDDVKILQAKSIEYDPVRHLPIRELNSLDTDSDLVTAYQYDAYGNVTRVTQPRGDWTDVIYETIYHTFPAMKTNALGHTESFVFDPGFGKLLRYTDANNHMSSAQYDGLGRIILREDSAGNTVASYEYEFMDLSGWTSPNRVRTITHTPTGDVWREDRYDGLGRQYERLSVGQNGPSDPIRVVTVFNDRNAPWKTSLPHWRSEAGSEHWRSQILENDDAVTPTETWAKMGLSRPVKSRQDLNATDIAETSTIYETPLARKSIDPAGHERRVISDAFGNQIGVWEPNDVGSVGTFPSYEGQLTRYGYDAVGRLECVRRHVYRDQDQDQDPITNLWYDTLGRKVKMDDPDRGVSTYAYDVNGNLTRSKDARGIEVVRQYDILNRMTRLISPEIPSGNVRFETYTYDAGTGTNLVGRLVKAETPACTTAYSYDDEGRTVLTRRTIDGTSYETTTTYDYAGRPTTLTYPDGMQLLYGYDTATQTLDSIAQQGTGQPFLLDKTISKFGVPQSVALGNNITETNAFDWSGRLTAATTALGASTFSNLQYTYGPNSNIARIQELAGPEPQGDMNYGYDALDRLTKAWGKTMSGVDAGTELAPLYAYSYDVLGRMTSNNRFLNGAYGPPYALGYEYPANPSMERPTHGVSGIRFTRAGYPDVYAHTFTYDPSGNLLSSTNDAAALPGNNLGRTYTWDALGRMASVSLGANSTTFAYDHAGNRVKKMTTSGSLTYVGNVAEVSAAGMTKHVFGGGKRIATIKPGGQTLFYSADHLNSSATITDVNGNEAQRMDYDPYGAFLENARSQNTVGITHTYTGQEADAESGLMYYRARYYDPMVGQFISPDRLIPLPSDPQSFNRLGYVRGNPILYTDPNGEELIGALIGTGVGAVVGAGVGLASGKDPADGMGFWSYVIVGAAAGAYIGFTGTPPVFMMNSAGYSASQGLYASGYIGAGPSSGAFGASVGYDFSAQTKGGNKFYASPAARAQYGPGYVQYSQENGPSIGASGYGAYIDLSQSGGLRVGGKYAWEAGDVRIGCQLEYDSHSDKANGSLYAGYGNYEAFYGISAHDDSNWQFSYGIQGSGSSSVPRDDGSSTNVAWSPSYTSEDGFMASGSVTPNGEPGGGTGIPGKLSPGGNLKNTISTVLNAY